MSVPTPADLIKLLALEPHPEGGYYRETYRSAASTAIHFLLPKGARSRKHRIASDELWHFHLGGPLTVFEILETGERIETVLGPEVARGHKLQHVVPGGRWFGAYPNEGTEYALVSCTVAPPFDFSTFELADE